MSSEIEYRGAQFYKCALQVNSASYSKDFRGGEGLDEDIYNQGIVRYCHENDIKVVGLADHGSVDTSQTLRECLIAEGFVVFPGFEIASSEKIHMVCLYSEETKNSQLQQYLGQLMGQNIAQLRKKKTDPSSLSCEQIAGKILKEQDGFWYAAHMTNTSGLLRLSGAGDNYVHLWKKHDLVVAGQIPGKIEDLDVNKEKLQSYLSIIKNKNPDYHREKPIAIINAKDVNTPEMLSDLSAYCLIKMTEPNFPAFRDAFYDPKSRVRLNHEVPNTPYSAITSIRWEGAGFFSDNSIGLSVHLNTFIGGRGTGKSTVIESIRYVLGLPYHGWNDQALERISKKNLRDSKIILEVTSKAQNGQIYSASRRFGEQTVVRNSQGEISNLSPDDILPDIQLLGQNEILGIEKDENAKLMLIRNFLPDSHGHDKQIEEIKRNLKTNGEKFIKAWEGLEVLKEMIQKESKLKEQAGQFQALGIQEKLNNAGLLEREKSLQRRSEEQFNFIQNWLDSYDDVIDLEFLQDGNIDELPNKELIIKVRQALEQLQDSLNQTVNYAQKSKTQAFEEYEKIKKDWLAKSEAIKDELNQAMNKLPEQAGKTGKQLGGEYTNITQQLVHIEQQKTEYLRQKKLTNAIEKERRQLLDEYRNACFIRFENMAKKAKQLNSGDLKGKIRIKVLRCGNRESLKIFLQSIEGIGESKTRWLDEIDEPLDLVQWSGWIKEGSSDIFMEHYGSFGLTKSVADKLQSLSLERRLQLMEIELKDTADIELNIAHKNNEEHYVPLKDLSTGQKCTAILNLLLLSRDDPLIIDQPEDNLDNAFITDRIVKDIRKFKTNRQLLFATHNANIPVLGDAELIAVLNSDNRNGKIEHEGSIDKQEVREQASEILEGGKAAFEMRKNKYGF